MLSLLLFTRSLTLLLLSDRMASTLLSTLGTLSLLKVNRWPPLLAMAVGGKLTEFLMFPLSRKSRHWPAAMMAQASSASAVLAPMWGISSTLALPIHSGVGKSAV